MARIECPRCHRPARQCYCQTLTPEASCIDLLILQHPKEVKHPLNTARIAELGIENCTILVGEDFSDNQTFHQLLENRHACLLFPTEQAIEPSSYIQQIGQPDLCIVLDGTWRKARKMFYLNQTLQTLPAVIINTQQKTQYRIRKAPDETSLSTIEASVALLRALSGNPETLQNCLDAFERLIDLQINAMGQRIYQQNYNY